MKKITLVTGICAFLAAGQVMSAELFRDDFDGSWTRIKCDPVFHPEVPDPDGRYSIYDVDDLACINIEEAGGELTITSASSVKNLGGGIVTSQNRADFNFFGPATVDPANPHKRVFQFNNLNFLPGNIFSFQKQLRFVIARSKGMIYGDRFEVALSGDNTFYIASNMPSARVTNTIFRDPTAFVPVTPHSVEIELGLTDYKVTFLFNGGGLYFYGQHGLDRASWETTPPDPVTGEATASNFYVGVVAASNAPFDRDTMVQVSLDSLVVTDGK